jgi:hypothetical protein
MDPDLFLVIGLLLIGLSAVSILSAFTDGRMPRAAAVMMIAATILIALAVSKRPGGYTWEDVPRAFVRVVAKVVN